MPYVDRPFIAFAELAELAQVRQLANRI